MYHSPKTLVEECQRDLEERKGGKEYRRGMEESVKRVGEVGFAGVVSGGGAMVVGSRAQKRRKGRKM